MTVLGVMRFGLVTEAQRNYREQLLITPPEELRPSEVAITLRWPAIMMLIGIMMTFAISHFYSRPYQAAIENQTHKEILR